MLLTASPEYFRPDNPSQAGYYEPERLADFQQAVHGWLDKEYGDRLVRAELHLDESQEFIPPVTAQDKWQGVKQSASKRSTARDICEKSDS